MKKWIFIIVLSFPNLFLAQDSRIIDSLLTTLKQVNHDTTKVNSLNKLSIAFIDVDSTKSFYYCRKALTLSEKIGWSDGIGKSYFHIGSNYSKHADFPKALRYYKKAITTFKSNRWLSDVYLAIGQVYLSQANYPVALANFHKALQLAEARGDTKVKIKIEILLAGIYSGIDQPEKALAAYQRAYTLINGTNYEKYLGPVLRGIGIIRFEQGKFSQALENFDKAYAIARKKGQPLQQAQLLSDMALVYMDTEAYQKAINFAQSALKIQHRIVGDPTMIGFNYGVIGDSWIEIAKQQKSNAAIDSAVAHLGKAIKIHQEMDDLRSLHDDYTSLTEAYKLRGNYTMALQSYEKAIKFKDSIFNSDTKETIKNLEDKRAIELRDAEIKISKLNLDAKEKQKWYLIGGLALLGIIGLLLFYQSRNRKRTNEKLQALNTDLDHKNASLDQANKINARFFSILNHDLRRPVYNLIHYLQLQKDSPELLDADIKKDIENKNISSAENLLNSMEDMLLWSKGQMENFKPQLENIAVEIIFEETRKHFSSEEKVEIHFENPAQLQLFTDAHYLKTIIRNLVGNALTALDQTANAKIHLKAYLENDVPLISVSDNGPGGSQEQFRALYDENEVVGIKTGLGLHLIRDLANAIDCRIDVQSNSISGTVFTLLFK